MRVGNARNQKIRQPFERGADCGGTEKVGKPQLRPQPYSTVVSAHIDLQLRVYRMMELSLEQQSSKANSLSLDNFRK